MRSSCGYHAKGLLLSLREEDECRASLVDVRNASEPLLERRLGERSFRETAQGRHGPEMFGNVEDTGREGTSGCRR